MIQLASQPHAGRTAWRPAQAAGKDQPADARPARGHPWPFISRHGEKSAAQEPAKNSNGDSGS